MLREKRPFIIKDGRSGRLKIFCGLSVDEHWISLPRRPTNCCHSKVPSSVAPPNVVVEWLTLLFRIPKALGSNLAPETGYPDRHFVVFLSHSR
jgi:hypothetical protein